MDLINIVLKNNCFNKIIYFSNLIISSQANPKINAMDITPVLNESSNQIENLQNLSDDCHDKESFKGKQLINK